MGAAPFSVLSPIVPLFEMGHAYVLVSQQQQPPPQPPLPLPPPTTNDSIPKFPTLSEDFDGSASPKLLSNPESVDHLDQNHPLSASTSSEVGGKFSDSTIEGGGGGASSVGGSAATVMTTDS
uniref:Expressed protein n=1 Tax=Echinococcus granulosus TaxID=6210 RepID=A0A068WY14_ECHGR|nr:expressed protein [Echinococcus granulosus]